MLFVVETGDSEVVTNGILAKVPTSGGNQLILIQRYHNLAGKRIRPVKITYLSVEHANRTVFGVKVHLRELTVGSEGTLHLLRIFRRERYLELTICCFATHLELIQIGETVGEGCTGDGRYIHRLNGNGHCIPHTNVVLHAVETNNGCRQFGGVANQLQDTRSICHLHFNDLIINYLCQRGIGGVDIVPSEVQRLAGYPVEQADASGYGVVLIIELNDKRVGDRGNLRNLGESHIYYSCRLRN